jgi:hypothetical protein
MPRRPRIQFDRAVYNVMARGDVRQNIVQLDEDWFRLLDAIEGTVAARPGWEHFSFVFLSNDLHLLVKTPQPNLVRGMQFFLSRYALAFGHRWKRLGYVFQGRYRAELIEDERYSWTVSRSSCAC